MSNVPPSPGAPAPADTEPRDDDVDAEVVEPVSSSVSPGDFVVHEYHDPYGRDGGDPESTVSRPAVVVEVSEVDKKQDDGTVKTVTVARLAYLPDGTDPVPVDELRGA